jgi:hypothetical protein
LQEGVPYYIKGAATVSGKSSYVHKLKSYGGNSLRIWRHFKENLDSAQQNGVTVLLTLPLRGERHGLDLEDSVQVAQEKERILDTVRQYKDHPALMLWSLGNELEIVPGRSYNRKLWNLIDDLAVQIHEIDPAHPVMTIISGGGIQQESREIYKHCPNLDLLGINAYHNIAEVCMAARQIWPKPYVVTEWGPTSYWRGMPSTEWNAPVEQTSSQKAESYRYRYEHVIRADKTHCLGSYVFLWEQRQERTHTWFSMFDKEGLEAHTVEVMRILWSGTEPPNYVPRVDSLYLDGRTSIHDIYLQPGQVYPARVLCHDPDQDELEYRWDVRAEVKPTEYAGIGEIPAVPVTDLFLTNNREQIRFRAPSEPGAYRLFVKILDHHGHYGGGNIPFYVIEK